MKNGIDLHLHLDGSLTPAYVIRQAKTQGIELPAWEESELVKYMTAPADCQDLNEYLVQFVLHLFRHQQKFFHMPDAL